MTFSVKSPIFLVSVLIIIVVLVGVVIFFNYLNEPQDTRSKAAVEGGTVEVGFKQSTMTLESGEEGTGTVTLNTKNSRIKSVEVMISYTYSGDTPPLAVSDIELNPVLANWSCPVSNFIPGSGTATIEFSCAIPQGYTNAVATDFF
jgi:hypothetical protein